MTNIIYSGYLDYIYSPEDLNSISNTITRFLKQYKLGMLLKSYNAYKSKRVSVIAIFEYYSDWFQQPFIVHELSYTKVGFDSEPLAAGYHSQIRLIPIAFRHQILLNLPLSSLFKKNNVNLDSRQHITRNKEKTVK